MFIRSNPKRLPSGQSCYLLLLSSTIILFAGCFPGRHQTHFFNHKSLLFTNSFPTARLNHVRQENDSTYTLDILPENMPINPSPWYAFKIWSAQERNINLKLHYPGFKHRYDPKQSKDAKTWRPVPDVKVSASGEDASFNIQVSRDTVTVAAQELISSTDTYRWMDSLALLPFVKQHIAGKSLKGKPIKVLNTTGTEGKKLIVVLSRQHPPEVTGYMAMQEFVRSTLGNSDLAIQFRKEYELLIFPMLNPDGADGGNWRHSAAGVDLNRDWIDFKQPETRAVKDYVSKVAKDQQAKVYFALDFHSTYHDVFYVNQLADPNSSNAPGFTYSWLEAMQKAITGFKPNIKPSGNGGNVSKSWFSRELQAEAITYEVGDNTSRQQLKLKGRVAAEQMMKLLIAVK